MFRTVSLETKNYANNQCTKSYLFYICCLLICCFL